VKPSKPWAVLIFGEDANDRELIVELVRALRPDAPRLEKRASPLILVKGRADASKKKKNAADVAAEVRRSEVRFDVRGVIAHADTDAVEPAHVEVATQVEQRLVGEGVPAPIAAIAAWETEAWLFLWPDAAVAAVPSWQRPARTGQHVGLIQDAKEAFGRAVKSSPGARRTYSESDAPKIAAKVRELGIIDKLDAVSDSYTLFRGKVRAAVW